jgi:lipoprotein-releasing system ATP-binding protein
MNDVNILECRKLSKVFSDGERDVHVLKDIDFAIAKNETVAIVGTSGSGKSTLLHLLGGLDAASEGDVAWRGHSILPLSEKQKAIQRNRLLGFVYQFHHLLPEFTALENVAMPLLIRKVSVKEAEYKAETMLKKVGLAERLTHRVPQLSGGEKQRVAMARALVTAPQCVLADEPTGNLDQKTAETVLEVMMQLQYETETSFIIVTHDVSISKRMAKCYLLAEQQLRRS